MTGGNNSTPDEMLLNPPTRVLTITTAIFFGSHWYWSWAHKEQVGPAFYCWEEPQCWLIQGSPINLPKSDFIRISFILTLVTHRSRGFHCTICMMRGSPKWPLCLMLLKLCAFKGDHHEVLFTQGKRTHMWQGQSQGKHLAWSDICSQSYQDLGTS